MMYLVDFVIPSIGYSKHRAVSSLGGISGRSATISNGYVTHN